MFDLERCSFTNTFHFISIEYSSLVVDKTLPGPEPERDGKHNKRSRTVEKNAVPSLLTHLFHTEGFSEMKVILKRWECRQKRWSEPGSGMWLDCHDLEQLCQDVWCKLPKLLHKETDESPDLTTALLHTHVCDSSQSSGLLSLFLLWWRDNDWYMSGRMYLGDRIEHNSALN